MSFVRQAAPASSGGQSPPYLMSTFHGQRGLKKIELHRVAGVMKCKMNVLRATPQGSLSGCW